MYFPRKIDSQADWSCPDGIKIYTLSARNEPVDHGPYLARLTVLKQQKPVNWSSTPAFAIFHNGATAQYLVLAWWGNDNELFTSVSVKTAFGWIEDPGKYSFCLWDLELFWFERNLFIETIYCAEPDYNRYRSARFAGSQGNCPV